MNSSTAIIGYTGFVGSQLANCIIADKYRSSTINTIRGRHFEHVICAGVQAKKWWANANPMKDWEGIQSLLDALEDVKADRVTLISSVDVYPSPFNVDENTELDMIGHHAYGLHRFKVEEALREIFPQVLVIRLPGLFGPGLKKNVIYDLMHDNNLQNVHPDGSFQYYDTRRLSEDIDKAWQLAVPLLNLTSEPLLTSQIRDHCFPEKCLTLSGPPPAGYDVRSQHASTWGGKDGYMFDRATVLNDLKDWLNDEMNQIR